MPTARFNTGRGLAGLVGKGAGTAVCTSMGDLPSVAPADSSRMISLARLSAAETEIACASAAVEALAVTLMRTVSAGFSTVSRQ